MSKSFDTEENGRPITTIIKDELPHIQADGLGPAMIGFPTTKLSLFQQTLTVPDDPHIERTLVATISVPSVALIELAEQIQAILKENKDQISDDFAMQMEKAIGDK